MNKLSLPLKIVTPKNKKFGNLKDSDFFTLDINGRSCSPQNQEEFSYHFIDLNKTINSDYENKKFKIRTSSNSVKTTRNWKSFPYQRIKNVQNIIQVQKQKQIQHLPQNIISFRNTSISFAKQNQKSPKNIEPFKKSPSTAIDITKKRQIQRIKQIQHLIRNSKQQNKQKNNLIKYQKKIDHLGKSELIQLDTAKLSESMNADKYEKLDIFKLNRKSMYSDIVNNRKKLSQRRQSKRKSSDFSLLGRINYLNQYQETTFVLRNSLGSHRGDNEDE